MKLKKGKFIRTDDDFSSLILREDGQLNVQMGGYTGNGEAKAAEHAEFITAVGCFITTKEGVAVIQDFWAQWLNATKEKRDDLKKASEESSKESGQAN